MDTTPASQGDRADELIARMTLEEKVSQLSGLMTTTVAGPDGVNQDALREHLSGGVGHLSGAQTGAGTPAAIAKALNEVQRFLVEETRLGIPAIVHNESLNGVFAPGFSSFPTPIALAATWDTRAVEEMANILRRQLRAFGVGQAFAPVLDVARDARWGRVHETFGEDPYLVSAMGVAYVGGIQGTDPLEGVLATAKHFLGYSMTEGGQNMAATHLGARELYDVYATPFEAAIKLANLGGVMNSYSEIDGVPAAASRELLTDMLRGRMGFTGSVVSDYSSVAWLKTRQRAAGDLEEAAILALNAGLDIELPNPVAYSHLVEAVRGGRIDESVIDNAVRRVLIDKIRLGLFDSPYVDEDEAAIAAVAMEGQQISRRLADEAITLLKNDGVLPLQPSVKRIAVVGPHADGASVNFAAYTFVASIDMFKGLLSGESRMAGIDDMLAGFGESEEVPEAIQAILATDSDQVARYAYGTSGLWEAIRDAAPGVEVTTAAGVGVLASEHQDIEAAVELAQSADVVVLAVGGRAGWYGPTVTEGEGTDSAHIELGAHQIELARRIKATGKPVVAVVYQGRPYGLAELEPLVDALLVAYYPGPEGPKAVASVIVGETNPSGKLPYTLPRATGQVPIYLGQKHGSGYRRAKDENYQNYVDESSAPLFSFGHGLSYTSFEYGEIRVSVEEVAAEGGQFDVSVSVSNVGDRDGDEIVQLYSSDLASGVTRPAQSLIGFTRVALKAGATSTVKFAINTSQLGYSGINRTFTLEPGPIEISVGRSSVDIRGRAEVNITGDAADLEGRRSYLSSAIIVADGQ